MKTHLVSLLCATTLLVGIIPSAGAANAVTATPTRDKGQTVYVDNTRVYPTGYNIADNNYFKLRDIGKLVGFGVDYDEATQTVEISTTRTAPSTEGITDTSVSGAVAQVSNQRIAVDGIYVNMKAYQIDGNNYVKLRDVGLQVNFGVDYDAANNRVVISPKLFYGEEPTEIPAAPDNDMLNEYAQEVIRLTNEERAKAGLPALKVNDKLMQAAAIRAEEITEKFSHTRPNGEGMSTVFYEVGLDPYELCPGENIASKATTPQQVVEVWMNSEGHRNAILNENHTDIGVGVAVKHFHNPDSYTLFWVQNFGGKW